MKEHEGFGPKLSKLGNTRKKITKTTLLFVPLYRHAIIQSLALSSPAIFALISALICTKRKNADCLRTAPQQFVLSCFSLQLLAWFTGTEIRGQVSKAPSAVSEETLGLPQGFSVQCKI